MITLCEKCGAGNKAVVADVSLRLHKIANLALVLSEALAVQDNACLKEGACWILSDIECLAYEIEEALYSKGDVRNEHKND